MWIDLSDVPSVLFFRPVAEELRRRGCSVHFTTREFAQLCQLATLYSLDHVPIGAHGGRTLGSIVVANLYRVANLAVFGRQQGFDLALSLNSYTQGLAARLLGLPFVATMDYEHQPANHLAFRLARRVIVPAVFPGDALRRFGVPDNRVRRYDGVKEQVYLSDFIPQADWLEAEGLPQDRVLAVLRPDAPWALYSRGRQSLFNEAMSRVVACPESFIIFFPRHPSQVAAAKSIGGERVWIPPHALDGPNLIFHADLVISGGGTMNREAAVLGTPAYTVFAGKLSAVDKYLIAQGRMVHILRWDDLTRIRLRKKNGQALLANPDLVKQIADLILETV